MSWTETFFSIYTPHIIVTSICVDPLNLPLLANKDISYVIFVRNWRSVNVTSLKSLSFTSGHRAIINTKQAAENSFMFPLSQARQRCRFTFAKEWEHKESSRCRLLIFSFRHAISSSNLCVVRNSFALCFSLISWNLLQWEGVKRITLVFVPWRYWFTAAKTTSCKHTHTQTRACSLKCSWERMRSSAYSSTPS